MKDFSEGLKALINLLYTKKGKKVFGIIMVLIIGLLPGLLSIFIWYKSVFMELSIIKLIILGFSLTFVFGIVNVLPYVIGYGIYHEEDDLVYEVFIFPGLSSIIVCIVLLCIKLNKSEILSLNTVIVGYIIMIAIIILHRCICKLQVSRRNTVEKNGEGKAKKVLKQKEKQDHSTVEQQQKKDDTEIQQTKTAGEKEEQTHNKIASNEDETQMLYKASPAIITIIIVAVILIGIIILAQCCSPFTQYYYSLPKETDQKYYVSLIDTLKTSGGDPTYIIKTSLGETEITQSQYDQYVRNYNTIKVKEVKLNIVVEYRTVFGLFKTPGAKYVFKKIKYPWDTANVVPFIEDDAKKIKKEILWYRTPSVNLYYIKNYCDVTFDDVTLDGNIEIPDMLLLK